MKHSDESRLTTLVAAHPWIDAEQVSALAGISHRQADRLLGQTVREGQLQRCYVAGLCTHGALYALRRRAPGIGKVASPVSLERALLQVESLWGARNLLAHLARRETLALAFSPDHLLAKSDPSPTGGKAPAHLDVLAWGVLARDNGRLPFVVEWDLGEIIPEAYRHRFDAVYRFAQWFAPSAFPAWVMVTTNQVRAVQLLWLWREAALRHKAHMLRFYVAPWSAVIGDASIGDAGVGGKVDIWRRAGDEAIPVPLFHGEALAPMGSAGQLDLPFRPYRRVDTWRVDFSAERVLIQPSPAHTVAHAYLSVPDRLARRVLRRVASWPLLSVSEVALLVGDEHETNVRPALRSLARLGLITQYRHPHESPRYYLTALGVRVLASACGLEPGRYVRYRRWPTRHGQRALEHEAGLASTYTRGKELDVGILVRHYEHTRDVRAFMVSLANVARHNRKLRRDHALLVWDESECRRYYRAGGRRHALVPDSGGAYRTPALAGASVGQDVYHFFLEVDRGTMSRKKLARKFDCYYAYRQTGEYLHGGAHLPRLLIVVPDEGRAHLIRRVILERARLVNADALDAWIAVQDTLKQRGPSAPIWRHVVDWNMRCCFAGFEQTDQDPAPLNLHDLHRQATADLRRTRTLKARRVLKDNRNGEKRCDGNVPIQE